jgi:hypothetical protein
MAARFGMVMIECAKTGRLVKTGLPPFTQAVFDNASIERMHLGCEACAEWHDWDKDDARLVHLAETGTGRMDSLLLWMFQYQVKLQTEALLYAHLGLLDGGGFKDQASRESFKWAQIQALLTAAANISKTLWGQGGSLAHKRAEIRESLLVEDSSVLRKVRMRNNFDHFDERIEWWWDNSKAHNVSDLIIDPDPNAPTLDKGDMFRVYDSKTGNLVFWGEDFNLPEIVNEAQLLDARAGLATEEVPSPHRRVRHSEGGMGQKPA